MKARRREEPRRIGTRKSRIRRVGLLAVVLAVVWGYDTGSAVATVVSPRPASYEQVLNSYSPPQPHVSVIPTKVQVHAVLD